MRDHRRMFADQQRDRRAVVPAGLVNQALLECQGVVERHLAQQMSFEDAIAGWLEMGGDRHATSQPGKRLET